MAIKRRKFQLGVRLKPTTQPTVDNGDISVSSVDNKIKTTTYTYAEFDILTSYSVGDKVKYSTENKNYVCIQAGTGNLPTNAAFWEVYEQSIVTEDQTQTLTNKDIDADNNTISNIETDNLKAGVLNTDLSGAATDTEIPSALAVKTALEGQNEAVEITYDPTGNPETIAVNVQDALDDTGTASQAAQDAADAAQSTADNHIADAADAHTASAITNVPSGNLVATDVQGALNEIQTELDGKVIDGGSFTSGSVITPSRLDVKQDTEANLITYAGTAADGQIVFATDTQKMYQIIDNALEPIGGGGSTSFEIAQVAHGFAVGEGIYHNGTTWVKAQANDADTLAYHVVVEVVDVDTFIAADFGRIEVPSHGYTVGEYYFLSDSVAGQATTTEPGSGFSNPLFYVEDANTLQIKCLRPNAVGDNILLDELSDVSVPAPTDGQALIWDNGNSRWEAKDVAGTAADITYDNSTSGLTATDTQAAIDEVEGRVDTLEAATTALNDLSDVSVASPNDGEVLTYNSTSGDWESIKAPSSQINYIENNDFEVDTTGWTGDTNLVISRITSGQLRGAGSLQIAKGAVDASTQQVYTDFTIDAADLAKRLTITFDIDASDANYSDDDMIVKIVKDPAGTPVDISVNGQEIKGGKFQYIGQFQTDATELDYRLVIEQVSTQASAVNLVLDNVTVGPREVAIGPVVQDWVEFTPTGTWTTNTTYSGRYRRVGDSAEFQVLIDTSGLPNAAILDIDISSIGTLDVNKLNDNVTLQTLIPFSQTTILNTGTAKYTDSQIEYVDNVTVRPSFTAGTGSRSNITNTSPFSFASGDKIWMAFKVPIQGWSANTKMSEDLGGREIVAEEMNLSASSHTSSGSYQIIPFSSLERDTTNSISGNRFTVPETGYYDISASARLSSGTYSGFLAIFIDGVSVKNSDLTAATSSAGYSISATAEYLTKGQIVDIRFYQNSGGSLSYSTAGGTFWQIAKRSSPQTILETETVAAVVNTSTTQLTNNLEVDMVFSNIVKDTHAAYNVSNGEYTVPVSGFYQISSKYRVTIGLTDNELIVIRINVDGSIVSNVIDEGESATNKNKTMQVNDIIYLEKGQVVTISAFQGSGANVTVSGNDYDCTLSIARIK